MKRKLLKGMLVFMVLVLSISLAACGATKSSSADNSSKTGEVEPLDLTGLWVQEGKEATDTHMVATIREDGKIGVFFILEDDPEPWTYWVGTYDAPKEDTDEYSWTSETTYSGSGMLASTAETKDFKYKSGKISYEVTIDGETNTITLVRGDWDTSNIPESAFGSVNAATTDVKAIEIKDSGWYVSGEYLHYYVILHNPNDEIAVEYPTFRVTARDANGAVIDTTDQTLSMIYPGQDFCFGSLGFSVSEVPAKVEFEMLATEDYNLKNASALNEFKPLEPINTAAREDKFVGEINNPNDYSIDMAVVVVVAKDSDGKVTYVDSTYVDDLNANSATPFSISNYSDAEYTDVEYYANQW